MTIQYRDFSTANGTATLTIAKPTGTADGDMLLMLISCGAHVPTVSGWTALANTVQVGSSPGLRVYYKVAASEPADYTPTWASGSGAAYIAGFYSDVPETLAIDQSASQDNASSGNREWPSVTTVRTNEMLFMGAVLAINTGTTPPTPPGAGGERIDQLIGLVARFYLMTDTVAAAGATGTYTGTGSTSASKTAIVSIYEDVAIPPPDAPSAPDASAISPSRITITWIDESSDEDGFSIERSADGLTGWTEIATVDAGVESYTDTGLTPETEYFYRVLALRNDP